jgi:hypothetical protein
MSEPKWTPGPWRRKERSNLANGIEGKTSRHSHEGDDGYRTVATYQDACDSDLYDAQEANREANGNLITAAPELYTQLEDARATLEEAAKILARHYPSVANNLVNQCAIRCGDALAKARGETP